MKNSILKKIIGHLSVIILFLLISLIYNYSILEGKKIHQGDYVNYQGMSKEVNDFAAKGGETQWTNSMFGGMPTYLINNYSKSAVKPIHRIFTLNNLKPVSYVFLYLLGAYIALLLFGVNIWLSVVGAIAFAFTSYNFVIIAAGHNTKAMAIGYMIPIIAGIYKSYKGKYLLGAIIMCLFLSLQLLVNHLQITYYTLLIVLIYGIIEFVYAVRRKKYQNFFKSTIVLIFAAIIAVGSNIGQIWTTYEYGKYSMRGKSDLTNDLGNKTSGLDKDYATGWSYGIDETLTVLIPNFKGGASGAAVGENSASYEFFKKIQGEKYASQVIKQLPMYWGDQPGTSGPVYFGAIIIFLFVLGIFILDPKMKWWLISATVLSIVLSWGYHIYTGDLFKFTGIFILLLVLIEYFKNKTLKYYLGGIGVLLFGISILLPDAIYTHPFNYYVLDYLPGYNKFRTVSMILVIAQFTVPLMAILALKKVFEGAVEKQKLEKAFKFSLYIVGGIALFFALFPGMFFDFSSKADQGYIAQGAQAFVDALKTDRKMMLRNDAIRSLVFILLSAGAIYGYIKSKIKLNYVIGALFILILVDLWAVDKRYLNNDNFVSKRQASEPFQKTSADELILKDKDPNFRVMNLTVSTFNDASTSYFHKSIGGYHGAKMKRYQELIEHQIAKNNMQVLNMLNTKYFIVPDKNRQPVAQFNPGALGNAWFVSEYKIVPDADAEIDALSDFNPAEEAIIDQRFEQFVKDEKFKKDSLSLIKLVEYKPNKLIYSADCKEDELAVFSEIYYPKGWDAYIDGELTNHFTANYVLRAMVIPSGKHIIEFKFEPKSYIIGNKISLASSVLLLLLVFFVFGYEGFNYYKKNLR